MFSAIWRGKTATQLAAIYAALFCLSVALLAAVAVKLTENALQQQIDRRLAAEMADITSAPDPSSALRAKQGDLAYLVQSQAGATLAGSLPSAPLKEGPFSIVTGEKIDTEGPDRFRGLSRKVNGTWIAIALDTDEMENARDTLIGVFAALSVVVVAISVLGGTWLSKFFLARLGQLALTAEAITAGDPKRRMPLSARGDEFDRLSQSLNTMLDKNAALLESQRRITSDIAHDIRTPLTRLQQRLEAGNQAGAVAEADELLKTFSALLGIAEIEEGGQRRTFVRFDLAATAGKLADAYRAVCEDQNRLLATTLQGPVWINGDPQLVTQAISNLIENVLAHTKPGRNLHLHVGHEESVATLTLTDEGEGVPPEELEYITKRFYRSNASRNTQGNGLGLSLVKAIADLHRAKLDFKNRHPGLEVRLRFRIVK
jgi:signal transduction histidine kinase